jgi:hypothetical protein
LALPIYTSLFRRKKEMFVRGFFSKIHGLIRNLEDLILPLACLILTAWTAYHLIKNKIGF